MEILEHNSLGTFEEISYLLSVLPPSRPIRIAEARIICINKSISFSSSFSGALALLRFIQSIQGNGETIELVDPSRAKNPNILLENLIDRLREMALFKEIYIPGAFQFDYIQNEIRIAPELLSKDVEGLRNIFINLGYWVNSNHPLYLLSVDPSYFSVTKNILTAENNNLARDLRKLDKASLDYLLEHKSELGRIAEEAVLRYERTRLSNHCGIENIAIISSVDVTAGFDIVSYETSDSKILDRFIEVKSYRGAPHFYISENELEKAENRGKQYYLYLVDRDRIDQQGFKPLIIQDPFNTIFRSDTWNKSPTNWFIEKK